MQDELDRRTLGIPVETLQGEGLQGLTVSCALVLPEPENLPPQPRVLFCLPGGGMTRGYFDLETEGDRSYSFGEAMARKGHVVVLVDHLGLGDSSQPEDGFLLHPGVLAAATAETVGKLQDLFRNGQIEGFPALPEFLSIGVGHSMGAMLTALTQGRFRPYDAVIILGAGPYGLYDFLDEKLKPLANEPEKANSELEGILRAGNGDAYWVLPASPESKQMFRGGDRRGASTLRDVRCHLLAVAGMFSMIPGSWAPECASIEVPVFIAFGDEDLCDSPHAVPAYFSASPHVSLSVLPQTGHTHFIFPSREILWRQVDDWLTTVPG